MTETVERTGEPTDDADAGAPRARDGLAGWWRTELGPLLRRVHFYAGLFVAPFVLVAAVTGLLYTATPQIEELAHHDQLHVSIPPDSRPLGLARQVHAATALFPGREVNEIRPSPAPDGTTRVSFVDPGLADGYFRTVFIDPYTGGVRGVLTGYGQWLPVRSWFDELHRTLHLGPVGEVYSELAASWLWVLTLSGLGLWIGRRRRSRRQLLLPQVAGTGRPRLMSWHGSVGLWVAVVLLFLSATGLTWSQFAGANVTQLRQALAWTTPSVHKNLPAQPLRADREGVPNPRPTGAEALGATAGDGFASDAQQVLAAARAHGLDDPVALDPPTAPGQAWVVQQIKRSWPEKQDSVAVDATTGAVVDTIRFEDWPLAAKLARWGVDAHMALLFGLPNQIVLALVAIGLIVMIGCGYRMWWHRRPSLGSAARPGFLTVAVVGLLGVGIGVALPVFGASLLIFLVADGIVGAVAGAAAER
jgi:uncharacterized iron-regulated membrane protein